MIEVNGLTKTYGNVNALDNLSFTVNKGEIVGFLGANGAGKTTTMDIMCGCIGADAGQVKICGYDITETPIEAKKNIGYLPDIPPLHPEMYVEDYITYAAKLHLVPGRDVKARVSSTIEKLSLGDVRRRLIGNLSKGYRQRVAMSQALVHEPAVLVLDEPTEGLDPNQIAQIRELIKALAGEHTILLSSHILSEVENTCEKIIIIHKGRIMRQGTYGELVKSFEYGDTYRLRVRQGAKSFLGALRGIPLVSQADLLEDEDNTIEFSIKGNEDDKILDQVCHQVLQQGYGIRELAVKTHSLEEVFMQITK